MRLPRWTMLALSVLVGSLDLGIAEIDRCPHMDEKGLCQLTMPNFTTWCGRKLLSSGEDFEEEQWDISYKAQSGGCVQLRSAAAWGYHEGHEPITLGRRCAFCAPFNKLEDCRRICEDDDSTELDIFNFCFYLFVAVYACASLAVCCEDYFVAALEILMERLSIPSDVAGATFMAAGSSSPELFVAAVTIFMPRPEDECAPSEPCIHKDPGLGVGTVVGSTLFNTMCIIGGSAIVNGKIAQLDWRIVVRDAGSYAVAILSLMFFLFDEVCDSNSCIVSLDSNGETLPTEQQANMQGWGTIRYYEAALMVLIYFLYVLLCWKFDSWCKSRCRGERSQRIGPRYSEYNPRLSGVSPGMLHGKTPALASGLSLESRVRGGAGKVDSRDNEQGGLSSLLDDLDGLVDISASTVTEESQSTKQAATSLEVVDSSSGVRDVLAELDGLLDVPATSTIDSSRLSHEPTAASLNLASLNECEQDEGCAEILYSLLRPGASTQDDSGSTGAMSWTAKLSWLLMLPLHLALGLTIPDCRRTRFEKYFAVTMLLSISWLGLIVSVMVQAFEVLAGAMGMSDATVGLVFSAMGTSLPDFLSSLIVAKKGMADMAVSNAFGSNIFDILLGLGFPWFLQICAVSPGATLYVGDPNAQPVSGLQELKSSLRLLFVTLVLWLPVCAYSRWQLNPLMGRFMCTVFVTWAAKQVVENYS